MENEKQRQGVDLSERIATVSCPYLCESLSEAGVAHRGSPMCTWFNQMVTKV